MKELFSILVVIRSRWVWMASGIVIGVAVIAANALLMAVSGWFITAMAIAGVTKVPINYFVLSAAIRALAISRTVGRYLERLVTHSAAFRILAELRVWLYCRLVPLSPGILERYAAGDVAGRLRGDIDALENLYLRIIAPLTTGIFTILAASGFVAWWDLDVAIVLFIVLILAGFIMPLTARRLADRHGREAAALAGELRSAVTDGVAGREELILLGAVDKHSSAVEDISRRLVASQDRLAAVNAANIAAMLLSAATGLALLLLVCSRKIEAGILSGPEMVMLLLFVAAVFEVVGGMSAAMQLVPAAAASAARITQLSAEKPPVEEPFSPLAAPTGFDLTLKQVSCSYDGEIRALAGFNLDLPAGARAALTGDSGSGKSTVAGILLRFRDYQGSVTLGGRELKQMTGDDVRQLIAVLPQRPHLFNNSIRENILVARPGAAEEEIASAVRDAVLDEWVARLPDGLDTRVGEGGRAVSGGEAKRIAIARTLLIDAPLIVLDEPTEGLDGETEKRLLERLHRRLKGKSLLIITHRQAPLAIVDQVVRVGNS